MSDVFRVSDKSVEAMHKLFNMLKHEGIASTWTRGIDTNQITIGTPEKKISAVSHPGSYGADDGLIEVWDFETEPKGWLTAAEAFKIIKIWWEEKYYEDIPGRED